LDVELYQLNDVIRHTTTLARLEELEAYTCTTTKKYDIDSESTVVPIPGPMT